MMGHVSRGCLDVARAMVTCEPIGDAWRVRLHGITAPGVPLDTYHGPDRERALKVAARLVVIVAHAVQLVAAGRVDVPRLHGGGAS